MIRRIIVAHGRGARKKWLLYEGHDLIDRQWPDYPTLSDLVAPEVIGTFETEPEAYAAKRQYDQTDAKS